MSGSNNGGGRCRSSTLCKALALDSFFNTSGKLRHTSGKIRPSSSSVSASLSSSCRQGELFQRKFLKPALELKPESQRHTYDAVTIQAHYEFSTRTLRVYDKELTGKSHSNRNKLVDPRSPWRRCIALLSGFKPRNLATSNIYSRYLISYFNL